MQLCCGNVAVSFLRDSHHLMRAAHKAGITYKAAENRVRHAGHGSKNRCRSNTHIADLERVRHLRTLRSHGCVGRIFPEFLHFLYNPDPELAEGEGALSASILHQLNNAIKHQSISSL